MKKTGTWQVRVGSEFCNCSQRADYSNSFHKTIFMFKRKIDYAKMFKGRGIFWDFDFNLHIWDG